MSSGLLYRFLNTTAWRMETPQLFGAFHIAALIIVTAAASAAAVCDSRRIRSAGSSEASEQRLVRMLSACGWILAVMELYKQLFLYLIVDNGAYDWWFFPFQLCSVPMYLCILLPFTKGRLRQSFLTFMGSYTLVSAAAALIYPEDMLRPYVSLTLHGFLWHGILLFIALTIIFTGSTDSSARGLSDAALLFFSLCIIAVIINIAAEPLMQAGSAPHRWAAMFYLNPYHLSPQPAVSAVQKTAGIAAGLILYSAVIALFSSLVCRISDAASGRFHQ